MLPLGLLVCVTGVSGSGKSTLVHEVLYNGAKSPWHCCDAGACRAIQGGERLDEVVMVDQSPIGRRRGPIL